ncbi:MAG: MBL fold metallo-hydrolase RNA specificity domain-containing protein [Thermoplasmatota archaeon]
MLQINIGISGEMMKVTLYGGVGEIGGNKIFVEDDEGYRISLDFGRRMGYFNEFYDEFLQPRSKSGIRDFLKLGILPEIDGIYRDFFVDTFSDFPMEEALDEEEINLAKNYWSSDLKSYNDYKVENRKPFLDAVFLSHAHFDHIEDISYLSPVIPVYCSEETKLLAEVVTDVGMSGVDYEFYEYYDYEIDLKGENYRTLFPGSPEINKKKYDETHLKKLDALDIEFTQRKRRPKERPYRTIDYGDDLLIGDMQITIIETDHSVPGSAAFLIEGDKNILYTGDIRFHGDEEKTLEHFIDQIDTEIDILIMEGTRIDSERTLTEGDVEEDLTKKFSEVNGLIFVDFPWKDLQRFMTVLSASRANDRTLVIDPRAAYLLYRFHLEYPSKYPDPRELDDVVVYKRRKKSMLYSESDYKKTDAGYLDDWGRRRAKSDEDILSLKDRVKDGTADELEKEAWKLAVAHIENGIPAYKIRGSPEDHVLMMNFWRMNELFDLSDKGHDLSGSHYIKCMCEPFNEEMQIDEKKLIKWLDHFKVGYDATIDEDGNKVLERSHVSGHASKPELIEMVKKIDPEIIIPVHTEHPEIFPKIFDDQEVILPEYGVHIDF